MSNIVTNNIPQFDRFLPRPYQIPLCKAFESQSFKKYLVIWPRRAGKDICALNLLLRAAARKIGTYFYIFPTFQMGRRILWDAIDIQGRRILTYYIPDELVESRNEMQMRLRLVNGSQVQILGSDNFDNTLVGTNAVGMVFSEYALSDSRAYSYSIPILKASDGWVLMVSTPRGKNALWDLFNVAKKSKDWFCEKLSVDETKHISVEEIEKEIDEGQMSRDLALQEFWTSFELGVEGSFYSKCIDDLRRKNQITSVMWDPYLPVHTAWDLGYNDSTCIVFCQVSRDGQIRIIDYYENNKKGLDHYVKIIKEKEYTYGKHIAPFDIAVHDLGTGISRWKMMHDLGVTFVKYTEKPIGVMDGIEAVRRNLPKMWIDERSCGPLLRSLENYRQEYDNKRKVYNLNPLHDQFSHAADAMRYLCCALPKLVTNSDPKALEDRYNEARYGFSDSSMPAIFRTNHNQRF